MKYQHRFVLMFILMTAVTFAWSSQLIDLSSQAQAQMDDHDHEAEHGRAPAAREQAHEDHDEHGEREADHAGEDGHAGHGDEEEGGVKISPQVMREFDIEVQQASGGTIEQTVRLPGEVVYNADRIAHVTPTVAGIVNKVNFSVGDRVEAGQIMAVFNSRELAAARSEYLASKARLVLTEANMERDQRLFEQKVGTERAVLESRQAYQEAQIARNQAENTLHALGYSHEQIAQVESLADTDFNAYELTAPLSGVVTERHLTIGEVIEPASEDLPFVVADLSTVWVNLTVYQRDLAHVEAGQPVEVQFGHGIPEAKGTIAFVSPALDETTRTATARIVLENPDGHWRPGLFVTGRIETGHDQESVVVPRSAITELDGDPVVFVQTGEGFEPRQVNVGRTTAEKAEILRGLTVGERFVARNVLALTAEMNRAALEHAGHAH